MSNPECKADFMYNIMCCKYVQASAETLYTGSPVDLQLVT